MVASTRKSEARPPAPAARAMLLSALSILFGLIALVHSDGSAAESPPVTSSVAATTFADVPQITAAERDDATSSERQLTDRQGELNRAQTARPTRSSLRASPATLGYFLSAVLDVRMNRAALERAPLVSSSATSARPRTHVELMVFLL